MIKSIAAIVVNASRWRTNRGVVKGSMKVYSGGDYLTSRGVKAAYGTSSWFYRTHSSLMQEGTSFKNSKLVFRTQNFSFLPYFMHPSTNPTENPSIHEIRANSVLMLSFVLQVEPELAKQAWENRRTIGLNFRQTLKILNVKPGSKKVEVITKQIKTEQFEEKKILNIEDISQNRRVQFKLKCFDLRNANEQLAKWQVAINLQYEDFLTLVENIKSNILYISGCAFQIQYSKARNIALAEQKRQRYSEKSKQSPKKQLKPTKKAKKQ